MLQLARGVRFGVDIADFLQLQRRFEADRVVEVPADEEERSVVFILARKALDPAVHVDGALAALRKRSNPAHELGAAFFIKFAELIRHVYREHGEHRDLRRVALRRRDGDLRARPGVEHRVGGLRDRAVDDVDDADGLRAAALAFVQRGDGVRGLARLGYDYDERMRVDYRIAVAQLARDLNAHGNATERFDQVAPDTARVIRGAASGYHDAGHFAQPFARKIKPVEKDAVTLQTRLYRRAERVRLLHYLLEHEVLVAALFRRLDRPVDMRRFLRDLASGGVVDRQRIRLHQRELAVFEVDHAARVAYQRRDVGGEVFRAGADSDYQRARAAHRDERIRELGADYPERVRALETRHGLHHGLFKIAVEVHFEQMRHDLGIGVAAEGIPLLRQLLAERGVVLDDAVVDDGEASVIGNVRVRVELRRSAVGRPARMPDAADAAYLFAVVRQGAEVLKPSGCAGGFYSVIVYDREARGVVAPVFEPFQSFKQHRSRAFGPGEADYSAH